MDKIDFTNNKRWFKINLMISTYSHQIDSGKAI